LMARAMKVCAEPGCIEVSHDNRCPAHAKVAHNWGTSTRTKPEGWSRTRKRILRRDGHTCVLCGRGAFVVDHLVPQAWGGTEDHGNLRALCQTCHDRKGAAESQLGKQLLRLSPAERQAMIATFVSE